MWCLPLKLQMLLLEVGDHLCPLLKLNVLRLHDVLKVYYPVGTDIHLLMSDVKQHMGVVPPMLVLTKTTVSNLQLMVLLRRWTCTTAEDGILMPQALQVTQSNCGALLICYQKHTLLHANPSSVLLKVEQVLRVLGQ
jgi:hypothetical protein